MKVISKRENDGNLVYSTEIVRDIVDCALNEVDGVVKFAENSKMARSSIKIDQVGEELTVDVYVKLRHDVCVSEVAGKLQNTIKSTIENMSEFKVGLVNVHVIDVEFDD